MDIKKEKRKMIIYFGLFIFFAILTFVFAGLNIAKITNNAGNSIVPMLFALVFSMQYRKSRKVVDDLSAK